MKNEPSDGDYGVTDLLDKLLLMRRALLEDPELLKMYIGHLHVFSLNGFIQGYRSCQGAQGARDERYLRFREWLREVKGEITSEGWATKFLRDCDNDHVRAIRKLLDLVAEFHAMEQRGTC